MDNFNLYSVLFVFLFLLIFFVYRFFKKRTKFSFSEKAFFVRQFQKIQNESDLKHAIMESDKLLFLMLDKMGYSGNLGDKLKAGRKLFSNLEGVWFAHKLRNKIAHELNFKVDLATGKRALKQFERAFKDLKAI